MADDKPDTPDAPPTTPAGDPAAPEPEAAATEPEAAEPEPEPEPEPHPLVAALSGRFGDRVEFEDEDALGTPIARVGAGDLLEIMGWLRDDDSTAFDYLSCLTAVDWKDREPRFDIVYNLYSVSSGGRLTVKTGCADGEGVATMADLWPAANWLERETYDLYGTEFLGHPDLRRVFLPEDWEGFPLRKDYPLEGPNLELLTRQQAAFRGGRFDRIRGEYEMNDQERSMAGPGVVGPLWTPEPEEPEVPTPETGEQD